MSEDPRAPLTAREFRDFVELYVTNHAAIITRLGNIETMLWQGQRIEVMQQRIIDIARAIGNEKLAEPFIPSPGMAQPVSSEA